MIEIQCNNVRGVNVFGSRTQIAIMSFVACWHQEHEKQSSDVDDNGASNVGSNCVVNLFGQMLEYLRSTRPHVVPRTVHSVLEDTILINHHLKVDVKVIHVLQQ